MLGRDPAAFNPLGRDTKMTEHDDGQVPRPPMIVSHLLYRGPSAKRFVREVGWIL